MNIGIPVAFLVSEPRLCATTVEAAPIEQLSTRRKREAQRTPSDDKPNCCVRPARDAKDSKVTRVLVVRHDEHDPEAYHLSQSQIRM
jgi:hypothetical protein